MKTENPPTENHPDVVAGVLKRFGTIATMFILIAAILFLSAGRLDWTWAWVYLAISVASVAINGVLTLRSHAETIAERGEAKFTEKWDKVVSGLYALASYLFLPLVAGLDIRLGWTGDLSAGWQVGGAVAYAAGLELLGWSLVANAYFSVVVRIQGERGHSVCDTGPYRFVRHPGYAGIILQSLGTPFLLGSLWALVPGVAAAVLITIRTVLEDRTLQAGLAGYPDYARRVHCRLLPGIW
jgi:protein-S-isoprenylcysteine O-methyltransferase Ste14